MHHDRHVTCACDPDHIHGGGCGHNHTHKDGCGHEHTHEENCGCGHIHAHLAPQEGSITDAQADVLLAIHQRGYLPITRFALRSSRDGDAYAVALEPVYIADPKEDMDTVKANGALFASLDDLGLITLDYDLRLTGYAYQEYEQSSLYAYFVETVKEASQKPGFVLDIPILELGSVAITDEGREALQSMLGK